MGLLGKGVLGWNRNSLSIRDNSNNEQTTLDLDSAVELLGVSVC